MHFLCDVSIKAATVGLSVALSVCVYCVMYCAEDEDVCLDLNVWRRPVVGLVLYNVTM